MQPFQEQAVRFPKCQVSIAVGPKRAQWGEPALRLAFVDLAGSERLPAEARDATNQPTPQQRLFPGEAGGAVADESRHINLSFLGEIGFS